MRPLYSQYPNNLFSHGFSTRKAVHSAFLPRTKLKYWRDVASKDAMFARLYAYETPLELDVDSDCLDRAVSKVRTIFQGLLDNEYLRPLSVSESYSVLPKNTSPGLPFKPGLKKSQVKNQLIRLARRQWYNKEKGRSLEIAPCYAASRKSLREIGSNKPRLVWVYPGYINILENQFTARIQALKPKNIAWSLNWFDNGKSYDRLQTSLKRNSGICMNVDFSSFDSTVSAFLIRKAFSVVRSMFILDEVEEAMFADLLGYFIHTPIVMFDKTFTSHRGIPSGSAFTQLIGSIINMIACVYADERSDKVKLNIDESVWLGDDSFLSFKYSCDKEYFSEVFLSRLKELGLKVNVDKTVLTDRNSPTHHFLGHDFKRNSYGFVTDLDKLKAQAILPEFKDKDPEDTLQRLVGLTWAYGADQLAYTYLSDLFHYVKANYRTRMISVDRDMFLYKIGTLPDSELLLPDFEVLTQRCLGIGVMSSYREFNCEIGIWR